MEKHLMKIINAQLISSDKRARIVGGIYIEYISKENVTKGSYVEMIYENIKHYFEISDISIDQETNDLIIKAFEVGYWATKFDRDENFDLRNIIGISITKIEDKETISKIYEMSCWC